MGLSGISIWQLLIVLLIVVMIFGTKRLKDIGTDLGSAVKGFRKSMTDADREQEEPRRLDTRPDAEFNEASPSQRSSERNGSA